MRLLVAALAAVLLAGCGTARGSGTTTPPAPPAHDDVVRVVNLNAAMGYRAGRGDPGGTDPTRADLDLLAQDIVNQRGDIANLQEMVLPAARELASILRGKTGDEWQLNWAHADYGTYYAGRSRTERPTYADVSSGNAQLIRIGDGIRLQTPITLDDANHDQGIVMPSGKRSFVGAEITTSWGVADVYTTHMALARQVPDAVRAQDVRRIQQTTESRAAPTIVTGDFNQTLDLPGDPSRSTMAAIRMFTDDYGYTDVARDKGPTIDQKHPERDSRRIDYLFTRGLHATDTVRFASHESDHWGLATTIGPA